MLIVACGRKGGVVKIGLLKGVFKIFGNRMEVVMFNFSVDLATAPRHLFRR